MPPPQHTAQRSKHTQSSPSAPYRLLRPLLLQPHAKQPNASQQLPPSTFCPAPLTTCSPCFCFSRLACSWRCPLCHVFPNSLLSSRFSSVLTACSPCFCFSRLLLALSVAPRLRWRFPLALPPSPGEPPSAARAPELLRRTCCGRRADEPREGLTDELTALPLSHSGHASDNWF